MLLLAVPVAVHALATLDAPGGAGWKRFALRASALYASLTDRRRRERDGIFLAAIVETSSSSGSAG